MRIGKEINNVQGDQVNNRILVDRLRANVKHLINELNEKKNTL